MSIFYYRVHGYCHNCRGYEYTYQRRGKIASDSGKCETCGCKTWERDGTSYSKPKFVSGLIPSSSEEYVNGNQ